MIALALLAEVAAEAPRTHVVEAPKTHVVEADLHVGLSIGGGEQAVQELALSDRRTGGTISSALVYRTRYFLSPFVDVGYTIVSSGGTIVPAYQTGGRAIADQRLSLWNASGGFAYDAWRLRLQGGLGFGVVALRTRLLGDESHSARVGPLAFFGVALDLVRAPRFELALKLRALLSSQHLDVEVLSIGFELRGDVLRF